MSDSTTKDPKRVRNIILIATGAAIIVATYLYLVLGQPAEVAESSTSSAGLIAMAGYLIGAVLLAIGSIHRLPTATIAMIPVAIALNIVIGQIVAVIGLPVYVDSIGTVLVAAVAGPAAGVVTGILTNVIWGLTLSPIALPFAVSAERDRAIEAGQAPVSKGLALHRMDLHLALLLDERLPALMQRLPELLPALCGGSPDPAHDLIGPLIEDQLRQGAGAPSALRRFIDDVEKLPLLGAFDTLPGGRQALIALLAILHGSLAGRGARPSPWPADEAPPGPASGTQHQHRPGIGVREPA